MENYVTEDAVFFEKEYMNACTTPSDINEHLWILFKLANECNHITEMGVRTGVSTRAFLVANKILRSYDLELNQSVVDLFNMAKKFGKDVEYTQADTRTLEIEETDLLFIDTMHTYDQLKIELNIHANKVKKYIVFHDTYTFGLVGECGSGGLLTALIEFMIQKPEWKFKIHKINNNGLTVIERIVQQ